MYLLGRDKKKIPLMTMLFITSGALDLLSVGLIPYLLTRVADIYQVEKVGDSNFSQIHQLIILSILILMVFYTKSICAYFINKKIIYFGLNHQAEIITRIYKSYQLGDYLKISKIPMSRILNLVENSVRIYIEQTLIASLKLLSEAVVLLIMFSLLLWSSLFFSLLFLVSFSIILYGYDYLFKSKLIFASEQSQIASITIIKNLHTSIEGFKELRILGVGNTFYEKIITEVKRYSTYGSKAQAIRLIPRYIFESTLITLAFLMTFIMIAGGESIKNIITLNIIFLLSGLKIIPSLFQISNAISSMRYSKTHMNDIYDELMEIGNNDMQFQSKKIIKDFNVMEVRNISFGYGANNFISNINFSAHIGECIQIKGPSGSGKSTLLNILTGLIKPNSGELIINKNYKLHDSIISWQSKIAYIPQNVLIYESDFIENITMEVNNELIDFNKLIYACKKSDIYNLILSYDEQFKSKIGPGGIILSGGERKKIALARALYFSRDILIMDELTAGLDTKSEDDIFDVLNEIKKNKCLIFTSHTDTRKLEIDKFINLK
jgi:ABC-type multidrug transport system fused ATPase/permease subunit